MCEDGVPVTVEFGGGTELLLAPPHAKVHTLTVRGHAGRAPDMRALVHHIRTHLLHEREELFVENDAVRAGILVLINDSDWELEGEMDYVLQPKDHIVFISTLHGG
ncbi:Ubiquitin- modifier 1 [Malassezia brasiliensis]|uniref:Ubiquitin-related modifier 1 n=1 Tax=Malassezia brasiliensis TaxID=1821822 RepID=A0AAF0DV73_9BASI|nr:Ubiquitin- modifier 1 [Malassezia brasiliensis]